MTFVREIIVNCFHGESFLGSAKIDFISSFISRISCAVCYIVTKWVKLTTRNVMMSAEMAFPIISFRFSNLQSHHGAITSLVHVRYLWNIFILLTSPRISSNFPLRAFWSCFKKPLDNSRNWTENKQHRWFNYRCLLSSSRLGWRFGSSRWLRRLFTLLMMKPPIRIIRSIEIRAQVVLRCASEGADRSWSSSISSVQSRSLQISMRRFQLKHNFMRPFVG